MLNSIVLIGAGKLATNLGITFHSLGFRVLVVCNRSETNGKKLANILGAVYTNDYRNLPAADLYVISVADKGLEEVAEHIRIKSGIVVHTSGTVNINVLERCSSGYGVMYPVQTFTLNSHADFSIIPICVEGNNDETVARISEFASVLSRKVVMMNSAQRLQLHLAAIIASNFSNYMYVISQQILENAGLSMELLLPLINETANHAKAEDIFLQQTGPAVREDLLVIQKHLEQLEKYPDYKKIYELITNSIINYKHRDDQL